MDRDSTAFAPTTCDVTLPLVVVRSTWVGEPLGTCDGTCTGPATEMAPFMDVTDKRRPMDQGRGGDRAISPLVVVNRASAWRFRGMGRGHGHGRIVGGSGGLMCQPRVRQIDGFDLDRVEGIGRPRVRSAPSVSAGAPGTMVTSTSTSIPAFLDPTDLGTCSAVGVVMVKFHCPA
ncbi:hypothetical protein BCR44DRAFT_1436046 [Catenaria anguillulae PL171]|uniref:Uncharacterized protein n=1 Tax=Catenaria anguillulae PL171 TaxID=765915 RepID=A0A1Y2HL85_9FUNG|nr:hypothetical protein BCR44DRAFT_1436046 [Catenaria anguillulae PL171]